MNGQQTMSLAKLLREFTNGDDTSWDTERAWLTTHHPRRLARIRDEIQDGNFPPIRLAYDSKSVIDGHHRIIAAEQLGLTRVPVADAWDGSDWHHFASDQGGDDPEETPMARTIQRCRTCRSAKGTPHKPFCAHRTITTPLPDHLIYVASTESGYTDSGCSSSSSDTSSSSDCGGGGGE